jgi:hypothetical protein
MKKMPAILFLLILFPGLTFSQKLIKGRIVTADNGVAVPGSSVFISNTSKGTTADKNGYFELNDVPPGKHELIISSIGYETNVFSFSSEELPLQVRVELQLKVKELQNVTVEPFMLEGWDKWGKVFLDNFIGTTPNAAHCTIKNQKAIKFRFYKKTNRLVAYCDEPVVIENKALGYFINFQLENFEVRFSERTSIFTGYPLFEEMDSKRRGLEDKWKRNREKAYHGSMMHFMRSVYTNKIAGEGFEVHRMVRMPNIEKQRVKKIYFSHLDSDKNSGTKMVIGAHPSVDSAKTADSSEYYQRILRQPDFTEVYGKDSLTADSLLFKSDGNYKSIYFNDYLSIMFKKEAEEEGYIGLDQFVGANRRSREHGPTFQQSLILLTQPEPLEIDVNGNYYPAQILLSSSRLRTR